MKRIVLITFLNLAALLAVSCKKDPKTDKIEVKEEVQDTIPVMQVEDEKPSVKKVTKKKKKKKKTTPKKVIKVPPGAPTFDDTEARRYVRDYEAYVAQYKKAVAANDMDSFLKLSDASSSLNRQYKSLITKLSSEEMDKMVKYMEKKTKQIDELTKKMYD
ncbi:hypothetical protein [Aquimarina sp. MMG016]|uniref:hypothetical protein n=1 Tax=Aquimarina sp. MMG016 TaxID=2822690 RepID=UPI001B3A5770|nr:hypothetical protein [Aquimarina sp. MMG016]MBQ4822520.1 hypothetical protein [Aquimarina sp. MMG016]